MDVEYYTISSSFRAKKPYGAHLIVFFCVRKDDIIENISYGFI